MLDSNAEPKRAPICGPRPYALEWTTSIRINDGWQGVAVFHRVSAGNGGPYSINYATGRRLRCVCGRCIVSGYGLYSMYPYLHQSAQIAYQEIGFGLLLKFRSLKACHHFARWPQNFPTLFGSGADSNCSALCHYPKDFFRKWMTYHLRFW